MNSTEASAGITARRELGSLTARASCHVRRANGDPIDAAEWPWAAAGRREVRRAGACPAPAGGAAPGIVELPKARPPTKPLEGPTATPPLKTRFLSANLPAYSAS